MSGLMYIWIRHQFDSNAGSFLTLVPEEARRHNRIDGEPRLPNVDDGKEADADYNHGDPEGEREIQDQGRDRRSEEGKCRHRRRIPATGGCGGESEREKEKAKRRSYKEETLVRRVKESGFWVW